MLTRKPGVRGECGEAGGSTFAGDAATQAKVGRLREVMGRQAGRESAGRDRRAGPMRWLVAFSVLNNTAFAGSRVAVSLAALAMGASPFTIGLLLSCYALLPMGLALWTGRWIDRIGMRIPMFAGTGLVLLGVALPFAAWSIDALYLSGLSTGFGFMVFHLATQKAAGVIGGLEARKLNFALLALGSSISGFVGPTLAGVAIDWLEHRAAFGLLAIMPIIACVGLCFFPFVTVLPHAGSPDRRPSAPTRWWDLLSTPKMRRLYAAVTLLAAAQDVHQFLMPLYGVSVGLSASSIGLILSAFALATFIVRAALPVIARRVDEWPLVLVAMLVSTAIYALYPLFPSLTGMIGLSFMLGLGLGVAQPVTMVVMHHASPADRVGEAAGLRLTMMNGTQLLLPSSFGAVGGLFGLAAVFWGFAALIMAGSFYVSGDLYAARRLRPSASQTTVDDNSRTSHDDADMR